MPTIDPFLFNDRFRRFSDHVRAESGRAFRSFPSNPYTDREESYKYRVRMQGRDELRFWDWSESEIGSGMISQQVINAIELQENNLVSWHAKYGPESRLHHKLWEAVETGKDVDAFDSVFVQLYQTDQDEDSFNKLLKLFGRKYPLLAYLFFIKDHSRHMPIAPRHFDRGFLLLGAEFSTERKCSWENYSAYNSLLSQVQSYLSEYSDVSISLLDAHSFVWMLTTRVIQDEESAQILAYKSLSEKERNAVVKARIGQGWFRDQLLDYWGSCAATGCSNRSLLIASHIKPWAVCNTAEALDPYNGLLLSSSMDAAFDAGLITFSEAGKIDISAELQESDASAVGIYSHLCLKRMRPENIPYLQYHREHIFRT